MSSTDFELDDDNFTEDDVSFEDTSAKISAKESLEKRRLRNLGTRGKGTCSGCNRNRFSTQEENRVPLSDSFSRQR